MPDITASPFTPADYPALPPVAGVTLSTGACGIRYTNRTDVLIAHMDEGTQVAGVFTKSLTASASVLACRASLKSSTARLLVVNSGNSNAFTGKSGEASVGRILEMSAKEFGCKPSDIFTASTGVIGEKLPDQKITDALPDLKQSLAADRWNEAARAIMTTDTYPKMATASTDIGGKTVTINGIAKGSGMIAPDMATMLAFVFTDANIPAAILQELLTTANESTFNCISVDGDTSTSDTLLLFATGKAKNPAPKAASDPALAAFAIALHGVLHELAQHVVKDGEGAEKLVTITVSGAATELAAKRIGMSIANSPLVKTALAASDANWGRIVMAVGKSGERADRDKLAISIGGVVVAENGEAATSYNEEDIKAHMQGRFINIAVDVGVGNCKATVWTCDLTHRYIDINGSYRT